MHNILKHLKRLDKWLCYILTENMELNLFISKHGLQLIHNRHPGKTHLGLSI